MPSTYSTSERMELMADGENSTTWGTKTNTNLQLAEQAISGWLAKSVAGSSDVTLTASNGASDEARNSKIKFTGTITANINVIVPTAAKSWVFDNQTAGAFTVTVKTSAGTGIALKQGYKTPLYCDGTNVVEAITYLPNLYVGTATLDNFTFSSGTLDGGTF